MFEITAIIIAILSGTVSLCAYLYMSMGKKYQSNFPKKKKHTIILGGESKGEQILSDILKNEHWNLDVKYLFDDRIMPGLLLHGIRFLGGRQEMIDYIRNNSVDQLIVAFPEIPKKVFKEIIDEVKAIRPDMGIKVLPSFHSLMDYPVGVKHIRDISIEDILGEELVSINMESIESSISGKTVLVTGVGGSIGSELVRQCARLKPKKLLILDLNVTELYHIKNELKEYNQILELCVANVTDEEEIDRIFKVHSPEVIFHAATYKNEIIMENFPAEAVKVNVGGTRTLALLACEHRVEKFVFVSSDKAVNPTNVVGATTRAAELIGLAYNKTCSTKFTSVRFGNLFNSRESFTTLFSDQIKEGGPVTVFDPNMKRYFLSTPEATLMLMQAGSMGDGGEVFVLDMGEPVKIMDMAKDLIRLHGLEPGKDIKIEITGLRPGEKLFEELLMAEEGVVKTENNFIFKAISSNTPSLDELETPINQLFDKLEEKVSETYIKNLLKTIVPTYLYNDIIALDEGYSRLKKDESLSQYVQRTQDQ